MALLRFIYGKRNKVIMDTINLLAEISILRDRCENYEKAMSCIRTEIIKQFEGCYLADDMDDYKQGEHHAHQIDLQIIDKYLVEE